MKLAMWLGLVIGVALTVALISWRGAHTIADLLASTHGSLFLVAVFAVPMLVLATFSWRLLFPPGGAPRFHFALAALWIGYSINILLPVAGVGGDVVRARLLALWSGNTRDAVASVVVDKTVQVVTVPLLGVIGLAALLRVVPDTRSLEAGVAGVVLIALVLAAAVFVQRAGAFAYLAARAPLAPRWNRDGLVERASDLDADLRAIYGRPGTVVASCVLRLLARLSLSGEVWLAARLLGHPISLEDAVLLKCVGIVASAVAFPVPAGVGIQEGSFVAAGALIGLSPDVALATSLATRIRELVTTVPGVLTWEYIVGRGLWRRQVRGGER